MNVLVAYFTAILTWLGGIALAKGFLSILTAIFVPPYAWYLVVEQALVKLNFWA